MKTPCFKCEARTDRCHSDCELYASWLIQHAERKKREREEELKSQDLAGYQKDKYRRLK